MEKIIKKYISDELKIINNLDIDNICKIMNVLLDALENEKRIFVFGNGGSGATASHMQNDFNKAIFEKTDKTFKVQCLNDNMSTVLAIANDEGYDEIFRYQLKGVKLNENDIIIAISGSGNSQNIINAVNYGKKLGCKIIGLTGYNGGKLKELSNYSFNTNINNMQISEDIHLLLNHLMIWTFYNYLGKKEYCSG